LQIDNLNKNTDYEHVVYANCNNTEFFSKSTVIQGNAKSTGQKAHIEGLNSLIKYFKSQKKFEYYLLLDSDCFPIKKWTKKLIYELDKHNYDVAAPVRYENLNTFAHPCAFFFKKDILSNLYFDIMSFDEYLGKYEEVASNIKNFYPLIRTNKINYHPILFGIYNDMFYHHGAGSRTLRFRAIDDFKYYQKNDIEKFEKNFFNKLINNSKKEIQKLTDLRRILYV